ncbi:MAG: peptidase M49 [Bryobacterales bacterium]|nr:peptidase M49 [Bryobacterales bacterium]
MQRKIVLFGAMFASLLKGQAPEANSMTERVGDTGFIQVEAESFRKLTPKQQELAYWLSEASIAIDPIIYDQLSRFGLRQKRLLESAVAGQEGRRFTSFTKLFLANRGNRNDTTAQKFLPDFGFDELRQALPESLRTEADELRPSLFDPEFEPLMTAKSPRSGADILQASANNFYFGVSLADLKGFTERYPLNSRVAMGPGGRLEEQVYRAGTPDGKIAPGLYAVYLKKAIGFLERAAACAEPAQAAVIRNLIRFYRTGEFQDWLTFGASWVQNDAPVDFANGFIEVYRDARGAKGTSQSFVSIADERLNRLMAKIAGNAQYFENKAPWADRYKKQGVKPPLARAVETVAETGDFHVTTIGDNLPNENEIHQKYGTKSFLFTGSMRSLNRAAGYSSLQEFASSEDETAIGRKHGEEAEDLMTAMHEIIGHGSGQLNPKLAKDTRFYLKEYFSTLEEARADLMALWNVTDPKLGELDLITSPNVGKAMYDSAARAPLTQLRRIPKGDTIEEDHQRGRQLIAHYVMDKTGAIERVERDGKTYVTVRDYGKMREGIGALLAELMRIKAEGDYAAIKALIDKYGVRFDPKLRDQVVARFKRLNVPTYWAGVNPDLTAAFGPDGKVLRVDISYPRDFLKQQLRYSAMYPSGGR